MIDPGADSDGSFSLEQDAAALAGKADRRHGARSKVVLVIDDDPAVLGSLKFSLEIEGFSVRCYDSPAAFLTAGDLPLRACLVVDQQLPGISGLDLLASLDAERRAAMPAILITSYPSATLRGKAEAVGVRIVEKPLLSNALSEAIMQVMTQGSVQG